MEYSDEQQMLTDLPKPRIILMGPRRSGKTSIERVVFQKMSPHETLFLESTHSLDVKLINNNPFVQFQIWDFPGDFSFTSASSSSSNEEGEMDEGGVEGRAVEVFGSCAALVYVLDAQDEPYQEALSRLVEVVMRAHSINSSVCVTVFIHKVDGDLFLSDEHKIDCQRDVQQRIAHELADAGLEQIEMSYFLTSIYDHSIFEAFSKVVQRLTPQLPALENLLNYLISACKMEKSFLFDVVSKLYVATDSNPVDMQSYELCADMIDVVLDVSCIYGVSYDAEGGTETSPYDSDSSSTIHLSNGMVLYLREVDDYLALVGLLRQENFQKKGLIDFNIDCLKTSLQRLVVVDDGSIGGAGGGGEGGKGGKEGALTCNNSPFSNSDDRGKGRGWSSHEGASVDSRR
ncbi:ras-related gtp binding c [Nannochloropsis oceanica]